MRNLIPILTLAASLTLACRVVSSDSREKALTFYIVSEQKIEGGRFIDTAAVPKAGYIAAKPDLVVTNLFEVSSEQSPGDSLIVGTNRNLMVVSNTPHLVLTITLAPAEAEHFASLTRRSLDKRLLFMLGDKPLIAPVVRMPIERGILQIDLAPEFGGEAEAKKVVDDLKKLIRQKPG